MPPAMALPEAQCMHSVVLYDSLGLTNRLRNQMVGLFTESKAGQANTLPDTRARKATQSTYLIEEQQAEPIRTLFVASGTAFWQCKSDGAAGSAV